VLSLPEREDAVAIGILIVIRQREGFSPIAAMAIGDTNNPTSITLTTAIAKSNAGANIDEGMRL
jgi:hypothetical protein